MDEKYFAQKIEQKWQKRWAQNKTFEAEIDSPRAKFYALEMLPYPSGRLHMGHVRNYSIGDALAWYKRLQGFNVLHPIGWDSFGQPAEQAAIKKGVNPRAWTEDNIDQMRKQLQRLGISYDWSREIAAHRPEYYKFDQWFFLKMLELGLAYKKMTKVNWCPRDQTTLSNEQASGGVCWRCGTQVEKKDLAQWFLKITAYAEELLEGIKEIEAGWAERVLMMQKNWIGRSEGAFVEFKIQNPEQQKNLESGTWNLESVRVFTTRIDTIYGANALVIAAEHPLIEANLENFSKEVRAKIEEIKVEKVKPTDYDEEIEKDGVDTGLDAINPFSGEELPVWVGNYVMMEYGAGAVMSVPAHDERDFEFAKKFDLPIREVVQSQEAVQDRKQETENQIQQAFSGYGIVVNSNSWNGKTSEVAKKEMAKFAAENGFGESAVTYRLRDWGISRQRFWGAPIPIVYCEACGTVPVPYNQLPVELPENAPFTGVGESPLAKVPEFVNTTCPKCNEPAKRETDTMDTFVDSTWYYFRYTDPHNREMPFNPEVAAYWTPVDQYIGGVDHAVMHLLYTRFWTKAMRDMGLVNFDEPVKKLLTQGMVVGESYYSKSKESYIPPDEVKIVRDDKGKVVEAKLKSDDSPVKVAVERMSKSKYNGVDPDDMVMIYGADAVRIFVLFAAPVENDFVWQETGIDGAVRFLQRVYRFVYRWHEALRNSGERLVESDKLEKSETSATTAEQSNDARKLRRKTHQTINRITENFESGQFNTPIAALMELSNALGDFKDEPQAASESDLFAIDEAIRSLTLMLAPYAPHIAEELWEVLTGSAEGILQSGKKFPVADETLAKADEIEIPVQINGKLRSRVTASPETSREDLEAMALEDAKVKEHTDGKQIVKIIVVPSRLVNIVVK
ncbi:MAG TPA: leucine--tRNA ligase [Pyrinomonadaceae bacterium]|nr:leucine--tRNA ligase [Pyrinomonadaceae bacterium]